MTRRWHWPSSTEPYRDDIGLLLNASVEDEGVLGYTTPLTPAEVQGFVRGLQQMLEDGSGHLLLCEDSDGVCGMTVLTTSSMPNCRHIANLSKGFLHRRIRGTAAVCELFVSICARARELGVEMMTLDVRENSIAHRVWSRLGWQTYGILPDYARCRGERHRGHYMWHTVHDLEKIAVMQAEKRDGGAPGPKAATPATSQGPTLSHGAPQANAQQHARSNNMT